MSDGRRRETREEQKRRHAQKAATVNAYRSKIKSQLTRQATQKTLHHPTEFLCPLKFDNTPPEVPVEPKLLPVPHETNRPYEFNMHRELRLDANYKFPLHAELDLGVKVDLINPAAAESRPAPRELHQLDRAITDSALHEPAVGKAAPQRVQAELTYDWLRAPQVAHKGMFEGAPEVKPAEKDSAAQQVKMRQLDRKAIDQGVAHAATTKVERILQSFDACAGDAPIVHPSRPGLKPVKVWNVVPDTARKSAKIVVGHFDANPDDHLERKRRRLAELPAGVRKRRLAQAIMRSPSDGSTYSRGLLGCYHLPDPAVVEDQVAGKPVPEQVTMPLIREYNLNVAPHSEADAMNNFLVVFDDAELSASLVSVSARIDMTKIKGVSERRDVVVARRMADPEDEEDSDAE